MLRSSNTLIALESLALWGYVGRDDSSSLASAYRFLRTLEHRIQMHRMARTHMIPRDDQDLRRLGRAMGFTRDPVESSSTPGSGGRTRSAGSTRSSSTGRCSTRSPGWSAGRRDSRPRRPANGWTRWASATRRER